MHAHPVGFMRDSPELSLDGLYGLKGEGACVRVCLCLRYVCGGGMCEACVSRPVCICVCPVWFLWAS